jgi:hypothetical protein
VYAFRQDEACGERDEGGKIALGSFAAQGDALETLELADGSFDAGAAGQSACVQSVNRYSTECQPLRESRR